MRLHPLSQLGNHPLRRFGEQLRQREGGHALYGGGSHDGQSQRSKQVDLALADDVIDQKLGRSRQHQACQPVDGHQDQAKQQKHALGPNERPSFLQQMPESDAVNPSLSMPVESASGPSVVSPVSFSRPRKTPKPKGLNLATLVSRYGTSEKCRELLCRIRWNNGPQCPRCNDAAVELETDKQLFYCKRCDYQFTVTAGTIFNDSHLPLEKWFMATLLICEAKKGISAHQIHRTLGISYKTAWYLCHRIR